MQNVAPSINLVYASGQFGGVVGQGWNINTISVISRMSTSIHVDGFVDGVDFDNNDKLALDGQRLLIKSGDYWSDGSTYQTEFQSNNKIEQIGTGSNIHFIVTNTDGSRSWYGNYGGINATDLTAFYITRFEDSHGNYVIYDYYKPFGKSLCLKEISFSANTNGIMPVNVMIFNYKQAKRLEMSYVNGVKHEKDALLTSIEVKTSNQQFRKYVITHKADVQLGYEKVIKIQEFNGANEPTNPIEFYYNETETSIDGSEKTNSYNNNLPQGKGFSGDFDGDGRLDVISERKLFLNLFTGSSGREPIDVSNLSVFKNIPVTTLKNNKLVQKQSIADLQMPQLNSLTFKIYNYEANGSSGAFQYNFQKTIEYPNSASCYSDCPWNPCESAFTVKSMDANEFLEGDFNGDGISELLLFGYPEQTTKLNVPSNLNESSRIPDPNENCITTHTIGVAPNVIRMLDLNPNADTTLGTKGYTTVSTSGLGIIYGKHYVSDFNGDGKADLMAVREDKSYSVFSFNQLNVAPWVQMELIGQGIFNEYEKDKVFLIGDYNGDSKTDIMIPVDENSSNWTIYYSNPIDPFLPCFVSEIHDIVNFKPMQIYGSDDKNVRYQNYYALDTNKDGKSDLVKVEIAKYHAGGLFDPKDYNTKWKIATYANNIGNTEVIGNKFTLDYQTPCKNVGSIQVCENISGSPVLPVITVGEFKNHNANNEIVVLNNHYNTITYIDLTKDVSLDNMMIKVVETGTDNTFDIEYSSMEPEDGATGAISEFSNFYSFENITNAPEYPNLELISLSKNLLVSKLENNVQGVSKFQDYKYHGYVVNLHGLGVIGFKKAARSSWYNSSAIKKTWSVIENNPLLRGATTKSYTQILDSSNEFAFFDINNIINTTINEFSVANELPYTLLQTKQTSIDSFTNIKVENISEFSSDNYFIPYKSITNNFLDTELQGTSVSITAYTNNALGSGNNYFIGRPDSVITTTNILNPNVDTSVSMEKYFYTGSLLTETHKKGNTTVEEYLIEKYTYDLYGNIIKKELSATPGVVPALSSRETEQTYDATGRFIISSKDVEDLETTYTYHPLYGAILTVTNPINLTTTNEYDNWGKLKKVTDFLGNTKNYSYVKENGTYKTSVTTNDGSASLKISDLMGRPIKSGKKNIDGTWSYSSLEYDYLGRKTKQSEPYSGTSPSLWEETIYDDYGRVITINYPTGLVASLTYTGLTVSADDGVRPTSSTKNANGLVVQSTDPGGIVNFEYYADGNLKKSIYEGTEIEMEYDGFGRKTKLVDPSAGTYTYSYNDFGELLVETTPKGTTTFTLNPDTGKLSQKEILGDNTHLISYYAYNSDKLLSGITTNTSTSYSYEYDASKRLWRTTEFTPEAHYQTAFTFDGFGRVMKEYKHSYHVPTGKSSNKWIGKKYKNGFLNLVLDDSTNEVLWKSDEVNERGQLTKAEFGNGISISNSYDSYGFLTSSNHTKDTGSGLPTVVMNLNTTFEPLRGNLTSRYNSLFNWNETFSYDTLDRLVEYTDAGGNQVQQIYEQDGRIKQNNLGTYNYANSTKKYQNTSINVTPESLSYYNNKYGIFNDSMESQNGWTIYEPTVVTFDSSVSNSGNVSLKIANTTTGKKVVHSDYWINIDNTQPTEYTYSVKVKSDGTNPDAEIFLFMKSTTETGYFTLVDQKISATTTEWVEIEKTFLVPANIKRLNVRLDNNGTGNLWFDDVKIRKVNQLEPVQKELNITYNAFKSPVEIHELGVDRINFDYNVFQNRSTMYYGNEEVDKMQRRYRKHYSGIGSMEIKYDTETDEVEFVTYLAGDAYSAPVVLKSDGTTQEYLYLHKDYLGSIVAISNQAGDVVEKRLFDAWGEVIKIQDGNNNVLTSFAVFDRGYTGHEHLQSVALVHMNGRLYDAKLHRFLQPDNFVQDPYNTQNYNRYGYVLNNPLKYTDPSGEIIWAAIAVAAIYGAVAGGAAYVAHAVQTGNWNWGQFGMSVLGGALVGGITGMVAPGAILSTSMGLSAFSGFVSGFMPSYDVSVGDWSFSISPSIAVGNATGIGAIFGVSYNDGIWNFGASIGIMIYENYNGFGVNKQEIRKSILVGRDDGKTGVTLGTNYWTGDLKQQTGAVGFRTGDFKVLYENDGSIGSLGDGGDSYRTAALNISIGSYSAGFNLMTGYRDYENENGTISQHRDSPCIDDFGRRMPNGLALEVGEKYRLGALTIGYKGYRVGVNSEHVRHAIQNQAIHNLKFGPLDKRQMGFENQSWNWKGYFQYKTPNLNTSW